MKRAVQNIRCDIQRVSFAKENRVAQYNSLDMATAITFDSGADGHYMSEHDRQKEGLPILRPSRKRVSVANGNTRKGQHVTRLPFAHLSQKSSKGRHIS